MSIDFGALEKASGKAFLTVLKSIPNSISKSNVKKFFDVSIKILNNKKVELENKSRVIIALCKTINEANYLKEFTSKNYLSQLPYENEDLQVQLFDVLYIVASNSPTSITNEISQKIEIMLPASPRRALGVLSVYGNNFNSVKKSDWQSVLDILIKAETSDYFKTRFLIKDYVSLLCSLCANEKYRQSKAKDVWNSICSCLITATSDESICVCYYGLVFLFDKNYIRSSHCTFPSLAVSCHLKRQKCQKAALSLLFRLEPSSEDEAVSDVLNSLIWAARTEINANLVLVNLAQEESIAAALVRDSTWMVQPLPTKVDTMRLYAVVLSHDSLLGEISKKNESIALLRNSIEIDTPGVFSAITTFVRRLGVTDPEYDRFCSEFGLLSTFFQYAFAHDDPNSIKASLLFIHTFANIAYSHELLQACDFVSNLIQTADRKIALQAARVACTLAKYPKCAARFQKLGLDSYFVENQNDPNIKKCGIHFFNALKKAEKEEKVCSRKPKETSQRFVTTKTMRPDPSEEKSPAQSANSRMTNYADNYINNDNNDNNGQPSWVIDEDSPVQNKQPRWVIDQSPSDNEADNKIYDEVITEEEDEDDSNTINSSKIEDSSALYIMSPAKKSDSDEEEDDNDDIASPFNQSRSSGNTKPPSPKRNHS